MTQERLRATSPGLSLLDGVIDVSKLGRVAERERREDELLERPDGRKLTQFALTAKSDRKFRKSQ